MRERIKKITTIIFDVLVCVVAVFAIFAVAICITAKKDEDGVEIFGYRLFFVLSSSMEKCDETDVSDFEIKSIPVKSCVFTECVPEDEVLREEWFACLKEGDVLTFKYVYDRQETITHRIVKIEEKDGGGYVITLEGDNKAGNAVERQVIDTSLRNNPNYVIGKVKGQSYLLGVTVYALNSKIGIIFSVIVPCTAIIVYELVRVASVFGKDRNKRSEEEIEKLKKEIERLKSEGKKEE